VRKAFAAAVKAARLDALSRKITPHVLRHTAATWAMQAGGDLWQIAGFLGMTAEMLERVYMPPQSQLRPAPRSRRKISLHAMAEEGGASFNSRFARSRFRSNSWSYRDPGFRPAPAPAPRDIAPASRLASAPRWSAYAVRCAIAPLQTGAGLRA
jgi:hypothetical protein